MILAPGAGEATEERPTPVVLNARYRPLFVGRPAWRYAFLTGGRGSAKSWHVGTFLLNLSYEPGHVILFTRYTLVSAELSIIPEFQEKIDLLGSHGDFAVTATEIVNLRSGSRILFRGIKTSSGNQTAALKSIHGVTTWVLDEAEELVDFETFERIDLSVRHKLLPNRVIIVLNPGADSHFLYREFVGEKDARKRERDVSAGGDTLYLHTTWEDNRENLHPTFIKKAEDTRLRNPARYDHIFGGRWTKEVPGLLWTRAEIERVRIRTGPELYQRVLVGIDPATTRTMESNETGIIVVGVDRHKKGYLIEDLSGRYSPHGWATIAVDAAKRWKGSLVAETNQGGDMVASTIRSLGEKASGIRIIEVNASRGKYARAEPVYSLYTEDRIFHVGEFPILESQMAGFNPDETEDSPDRVDAMVWAFTAALLKPTGAFVT